MTLDGIITLLALLVAIYALLPQVSKLRARLGIALQLPLAIIAFLLIISIQFSQQINYVCSTTLISWCQWLPSLSSDLFTPPELSFLVTLAWIGLACVVYRIFSRPRSCSSLRIISKIVDNLIYEQRYAELIELIEPQIPLINRASRRSLLLQKIHDRVRFMKGGNLADIMKNRDQIQRISKYMRLSKTFVRRLYYYIGCLSVIIPRQRKLEIIAGDIERAICQSRGLRGYVVPVRKSPIFEILNGLGHQMLG